MISSVGQMLKELQDHFYTTLASSVPDGVAWPNQTFEPPQPAKTTLWGKFDVEVGDAQQVESGGAGNNRFRYVGAIVVSLFNTPGVGDSAALDLATTIEGYYRSTVVAGAQFRTPSVVPAGRSGNWWVTRIRCPFFADRVA